MTIRKRILLNIIIIVFIILMIILVSIEGFIEEFDPLVIEKKDGKNEALIINFKEGKVLFTGWEAFLKLDNSTDRILGSDELNKGYFKKEFDEELILNNKISWHNKDKDPIEAGYFFNNPHFKPYIKIEMFAKTAYNLQEAGYGFILREGYDIYLPNGTILNNDHEVVNGNPGGTTYKTEVNYQIFYNGKDGILIFGDFDYVDNIFKWELFRPVISKKLMKDRFSPLYLVYFKNLALNYENGWLIESKQFTGNVGDYIEEVKKELDNN